MKKSIKLFLIMFLLNISACGNSISTSDNNTSSIVNSFRYYLFNEKYDTAFALLAPGLKETLSLMDFKKNMVEVNSRVMGARYLATIQREGKITAYGMDEAVDVYDFLLRKDDKYLIMNITAGQMNKKNYIFGIYISHVNESSIAEDYKKRTGSQLHSTFQPRLEESDIHKYYK